MKVSTILKSIQLKRPKLYKYIDNYMMNCENACAPGNIDLLAQVIERGVTYLQSKA